jgi:hypothetical protein
LPIRLRRAALLCGLTVSRIDLPADFILRGASLRRLLRCRFRCGGAGRSRSRPGHSAAYEQRWQ